MHPRNFFLFLSCRIFHWLRHGTSFVLEVLSSWKNLLNKIVRFQDFSPEMFEDIFTQKFRKQTILFCKLLLLQGTYRKIGVYHNIANGKSYMIETKRNFRDAFQGAKNAHFERQIQIFFQTPFYFFSTTLGTLPLIGKM